MKTTTRDADLKSARDFLFQHRADWLRGWTGPHFSDKSSWENAQAAIKCINTSIEAIASVLELETLLAAEKARLDWLLPRQYDHNTRDRIDAELIAKK